MQLKRLMVLLVALALVLVACGGDGNGADGNGGDGVTEPPAEPVGDAQQGQELYNMTTIADTGAPGCITCHSTEPTDDPLEPSPVGPSHAGLANRAGDYVEEMSAEEYIRESIVEPDAHIVEGYSPGLMYQNYEEDLSEQQIDDLVAYLLTLE